MATTDALWMLTEARRREAVRAALERAVGPARRGRPGVAVRVATWLDRRTTRSPRHRALHADSR